MNILTNISRFKVFVIFIFLVSELPAQTDKPYSEEKEALILSVENSLAPPTSDSSDLTWSMSERMEFYKVAAVSIAVIDNYEIAWAKAYGLADKESNTPATTKTLFQAASISKSLNAVGVLNWVESNNKDLNADINLYLKSWQLKSSKKAMGKKITLANVLSHTAGLSSHGFNGYQVGQQIPTTEQILSGKKPANSKKVKSIFEPDKEFKYSGGGVMMTQLLLSDNTGVPYDKYMKETVLDPLGMKESSFTQPPSKDAPLATAYWTQGTPLDGKYHVYPEMAAAGLWTTPTDICHYIIETQKSLTGTSNKLLSKEMTKKMLSPYLEGGMTGLGVFVESINGQKYFTHGGSNEGFKTYYLGSMEEGKGLVIMINSESFDIVTEVIRSVAKVYEW